MGRGVFRWTYQSDRDNADFNPTENNCQLTFWITKWRFGVSGSLDSCARQRAELLADVLFSPFGGHDPVSDRPRRIMPDVAGRQKVRFDKSRVRAGEKKLKYILTIKILDGRVMYVQALMR